MCVMMASPEYGHLLNGAKLHLISRLPFGDKATKTQIKFRHFSAFNKAELQTHTSAVHFVLKSTESTAKFKFVYYLV